ncbi:hypothetical protein KA344_05825 [bacterium]|nr:hypothetical protein [bacterium]
MLVNSPLLVRKTAREIPINAHVILVNARHWANNALYLPAAFESTYKLSAATDMGRADTQRNIIECGMMVKADGRVFVATRLLIAIRSKYNGKLTRPAVIAPTYPINTIPARLINRAAVHSPVVRATRTTLLAEDLFDSSWFMVYRVGRLELLPATGYYIIRLYDEGNGSALASRG